MEAIEKGTQLFKETKEGIKIVTVENVGRIYFTIIGSNNKFNKQTLLYSDKDYFQFNIQLYRTAEEIQLKNEYSRLLDKLQKYFNWSNKPQPTIEQLRKIDSILFEIN